ncbi:type VI secretion system contractile sheath domain-containing protein [Marinibactrum halimedae]|uniref:TssC1 N-terminal domain-containing protein n=1 Tax=Marinibactrum halimedae TaxID=1444977 RepID=A0AA37T3J4_9GAMM|nr:type VI secretion system contractile sheath large subunit [Marinibactrum halimedae]MCD9458366.1 type VI secretion system contractile sheath large subunit [Marinibactrum halimedae]GLS26063.1 hypothetical protein GCM10007877_17780 [Marinibactrum halimedae]
MSRATTTASSTFSSGDEQSPTPINTPVLKVAILGDFSGRQNQGLCEPETIATRTIYHLNKDNFDNIFNRMKVRLQLPFMDNTIEFFEFDDLHPDYLYSRVPLFERFIELQKQLLTPSQFDTAAREIQSWAHYEAPKAEAAPNTDNTDAAATASHSSDSLLDTLLGNSQAVQSSLETTEQKISALIKSIVSPYVESQDDPRQDALLDALLAATNESMRKIMHQSDFQSLESSWRAIYFLLRRLESSELVQLHLIDVSKEELLADLEAADGDLENAGIFKRLVSTQTSYGERPFNLVLGDFYVEDTIADIGLMIDLATIAEATQGVFVGGASSKIAGCPTLAGSTDPDDWYYPLSDDFKDGWNALREYDATEHTMLVAPRFLLRLPYGTQTSTIDCFDYEELAQDGTHKYYLWGNGAYAATLLLCENYLAHGPTMSPSQHTTLGNMPLHVFKQYESNHVKPCAEAVLTDTSAKVFRQAGICVMRCPQNQDHVMIPHFISLHEEGILKGPWRA